MYALHHIAFYGCNVIIADPGYTITEWSVTFDLTLLLIDNIHTCIAFSVCEFSTEGKGAEHLATSKCAASDNIYKEAFFVHQKYVNININFHCLLISLIDLWSLNDFTCMFLYKKKETHCFEFWLVNQPPGS